MRQIFQIILTGQIEVNQQYPLVTETVKKMVHDNMSIKLHQFTPLRSIRLDVSVVDKTPKPDNTIPLPL